MTLIIACPNCQLKYRLPDKLHGKKLRCKSCGNPFIASNEVALPTVVPDKPVSRPTRNVDPQTLSSMGIDEIRQQADPFAAPAYNASDPPLGNQFVQDPGLEVQDFSFDAGNEVVDELVPESDYRTTAENDGLDYALQPVVSNPYAKETPKPSGRKAVEENTPSQRRKKKRKKKVHPAVKDSLDKATMTLLVVGVLIAMLFGFFFIAAPGDAMTEVKNGNLFAAEVLTEAQMEEKAIERTFVKRIFFGIGIGVGVWFIALGLGVQFFPITCSITGLVTYIFFELLLCIFLLDFLSITGWLRRVFVCGALGKSFMDATNARQHEIRMAERRASGK